ncbi:spore germination protein, GerA [Neobacillus bataviensis LMG 21833]|uniref:Spore germination protein, GerA n=1 Tax=Neobacillus bataviensis LMG 21833 TaxID=1117379 RepID=K6DMW2_9BACI|nr:spore germination protein [Neobacillus bataviensis]EKN69488.1 spore germination protein, GerA [Neobacillus bataviensis LMG 21833]
MFKWLAGKKKTEGTKPHSLTIDGLKEQIKSQLNVGEDLTFRTIKHGGNKLVCCYMKSLIDKTALDEFIVAPIQENTHNEWTYESIVQILPIADLSAQNQIDDVVEGLNAGYVYIYVEGQPYGILGNVSKTVERGIEKAETESLVYGPKIAFTESLIGNINILRQNIKDTNLCMEDLTVGTRTKTEAKLIYIKDIADEENVNEFREKISQLEIDHVPGTTVLGQLIENNSWTVFPQLVTTELPDRVSIALMRGKVVVLMDRSPDALYGPTPFFTFFESTEDVYMRWNMGIGLRVLRLLAAFMSVLLTPAYVAVLTYHYEIIPSPLLVSLGQSRANVPFPPVFEALLLEFFIELLREAGARLPTKVGQTMGIVGGIVVGQAAVDAGFTSNILIIIIALSALGSFTTPSYLMSTSIRMIRFPIILLAGFWGGIGIMVAFCFFLIHLLRLDTMGGSYLSPVYPLRWKDLGYSFFRVPTQYLSKRPISNRPIDVQRFSPQKAKKKDVDE